MNLVFAVIADEARISDGGKLDILGMFSEIRASSFPATHPKMSVVMRFEVASVEFGLKKNVRLPIVGPGGKEVIVVEGIFAVTVPNDGSAVPPVAMVDQILELTNITFPEPGSYGLHVMVSGETKGSVALELRELE